MNFSVSVLAAGFIYGVIGIYWIKRAKRDGSFLSAIFGIALMVYPYFVENVYLLWGLGAAICFAAYKLADR